MRVGIVGTGIAGLTAAWLFERAGFDVSIFEKQARLGMDAHGVEFEIDGSRLRADVPPRMFNHLLWPQLCRLYRELEVESCPVNPSKTFARLAANPGSESTEYRTLLKLGSSFRPKLSPKLLLDPWRRQVLADISRLMQDAPRAIEQGVRATMGEFLKSRNYTDAFVDEFLYPALSSTVCTCSYDRLDDYPADVLLSAMLKLVQPDGLSRTRHGTSDVVERLTRGIAAIQLNTTVSQIVPTNEAANVVTTSDECFSFDHVIVATQANGARSMLGSSMKQEREMLAHFHYEDVPVVVHTDTQLMPARESDWSHFNLISDAPSRKAMCTVWMNQFCPEWNLDSPVFETIMPLKPPRSETLIRAASMQRPVVNQRSIAGLRQMAEVHAQPNQRVWFCGSYASPGIPLLESGVVSSLNVAEKLGVGWPVVSRPGT